MENSNLLYEVLSECRKCIQQWKEDNNGVLPIQYGEYITMCWNYGGDWLHSAIDMLMTEFVEEEVTPFLEYELMKENIGVVQATRIIIGKQISQNRKNKGLTQRELAALCGVTFQNINKIELGRYSVGLDVLGKICDSLGCELTINEKAEG